MRVDIKIPAMGESVIEATIGGFLKQGGAQVKVGEEVIEIETDKVNQVLYAPADGQIQWNVKTGDVVKVGDVVGFVETDRKGGETEKKEEAPPPRAQAGEKKEEGRAQARVGVDQAIEEMKEPIPQKREMGRESRQKMTKLRRVIAERLVEVKNKTALLTTFNEVDMSSVIKAREENQKNFQEKHGIKLGFMSFFIKACVHALQEFPTINARIDKEDIVYHHYYNIGVAVSTEKGLMVPVIRDADLLSYADIEKELKNFAEKARSGTISVDDMQGGTFTITNGGVFGSLLSTPILNPPQSGILGMHNIVKRPVVVDDKIVIRPMMYLALSYDHRIVDGKESIQFLVSIKKNLEDPARLLLDL